jgi:hypothetical protein
MPKRVDLNFGDIETWINNISSECAEKAAEDITRQLKIKGPYWTGEFEQNWEVVLGDTEIPAIEQRRGSDFPSDIIKAGPQPRQLTPLRAGVDFPIIPKGTKKPKYTIDNRMAYRDIAKDLIPTPDGRYRGDYPRATAPRDWYVNYTQGGGLATTLALSTDRVSKDPKIKNFKGNLNR